MNGSEAQDPAQRRKTDALARACAADFQKALLAADRSGAEDAVERALDAGIGPIAVQVLVIEPAMRGIGESWEHNEITVADEHLATAICHQVMARMFDALIVAPPRSRERVLLAAVEGQEHVLGLRMIADVLDGAGYYVQYLGASVPVDALRQFAAEHEPAVTGLSYSVAINMEFLVESLFAIREATPESRIMLGGQAAQPGLLATGYPWVKSSLEVIPTVERLLAEPPQDIPPFFQAMRPG